MPTLPFKADLGGHRGGFMTPEDAASYTKDLLDALRKIARLQGQELLAHLLDLALLEAKVQAENHHGSHAQET